MSYRRSFLAEIGGFADSLDAGRIGSDHARVLAGAINERNAAALAPVLDDLLEASQAMVFDVWKAHVEALAEMADPDGSHDPDTDLLRNTLTLSPSSNFLLLRGELLDHRDVDALLNRRETGGLRVREPRQLGGDRKRRPSRLRKGIHLGRPLR